MEENFDPVLQQFIEQGQAQVLSNLKEDSNGFFAQNLVASFGVGTGENDTLTGFSGGNSNNSGVIFEFVPTEAGTVDPVTGNEVMGQVNLIADGETTPLFNLSFGGSLPSFLSIEQQTGSALVM